MTVTPPATLAVDNDITGGLEPVQIPAIGLTADQLQTLLAAFNTLSNGISISDTAAVQHSPFASLETAESPVSDDHISSSGGSDGETDTWTCTCAYSSGIGEGWLCTANDGDACDCVSDFGNFYSLPDEGQSVLLLVHVVPAVRTVSPNTVFVHLWGGGEGWPRAAIYSKTVIRPGEELTFDYANASGGPTVREAKGAEEGSNRTRCLCGADRCRGWMPFDESL
ncbi:hypothetical protein CI109_100813 [Kwoniella shandongensis]|uniref:Post-SET domain-containing protein n=1 Tax=Kwoniella shandongensis TaxID=1734106 RepID=A0AAJ8LEP2_9TREE